MIPRRDPASGFDAFISYSHRADGLFAAAFQRDLERFAKPWYQIRSLRVFRDDTNLSPGPLKASIERALADSEWLILLACPESAGSPWVNKEVEWWQDRLMSYRHYP